MQGTITKSPPERSSSSYAKYWVNHSLAQLREGKKRSEGAGKIVFGI